MTYILYLGSIILIWSLEISGPGPGPYGPARKLAKVCTLVEPASRAESRAERLPHSVPRGSCLRCPLWQRKFVCNLVERCMPPQSPQHALNCILYLLHLPAMRAGALCWWSGWNTAAVFLAVFLEHRRHPGTRSAHCPAPARSHGAVPLRCDCRLCLVRLVHERCLPCVTMCGVAQMHGGRHAHRTQRQLLGAMASANEYPACVASARDPKT